jgi:multisubunit Na+/H+ antiporter MnhB subunit
VKWGASIGITVLVAIMILYEWPKIKPNQKKEKAVFIGLTAMGWLLGVLLLFFPDLPSPTKLLDTLFGPLSQKLLE